MNIKPNTYYKRHNRINQRGFIFGVVMNIKPNTYYKRHHSNIYYDIFYTGEKHAYLIACKYNNEPLIKYDPKVNWGTIKGLQEFINHNNYKIEEITKEDLFLELL